jgi:hypothetical protein
MHCLVQTPRAASSLYEGAVGPEVLDISKLHHQAGIFTRSRLHFDGELRVEDFYFRLRRRDPSQKIGRPRQLYIGPKSRIHQAPRRGGSRRRSKSSGAITLSLAVSSVHRRKRRRR